MNTDIKNNVYTLLCWSDIEAQKDFPLSTEASFRIGGPADLMIWPHSAEDLINAIELLKKFNIGYFIAGRMSDLLFSDKGFRGAVISTSKIKGIEINGKNLTAKCGETLTGVATAAAEKALAGFEFAYGIPGSVGGGVFMNAGAYGGQISDVFVSCEVYDSEKNTVYTISKEDADLSYRHSFFTDKPHLTVLSAEFLLEVGNKDEIKAKMADLMARRRDKQPLEYPSAGSTFKRPREDVYVGKLIEEAGLKGYSVGGARVSEKHAGFVINGGSATEADVKALVNHIKKTILEKNGIELECEIRFIPETPEII